MDQLTFSSVSPEQESLVLSWLHKPHVNEWFHGTGLQNTIEGLRAFVTNGIPRFDPWIAYCNDKPFAFLLTSDVLESEANYPENPLAKWIEAGKKAITLDLLIGEEIYLGKGLSVPMIQGFLEKVHPDKDLVFIDPEEVNKKAIHVYAKAGFEKIDNFIASWHPVPHLLMRLRQEKQSIS
jgi:hypothetical protein